MTTMAAAVRSMGGNCVVTEMVDPSVEAEPSSQGNLERPGRRKPVSPMATIEMRGLCYRAGGRDVVRHVDCSLKAHRVGVVGRNGSGKSTLARLLAGLIAPTGGRALINGVDLARDRRAAIRQVGVLFQNPDHQIIFPTVLEEVAFGLRQLGGSKAEANEGAEMMLARFGRQAWRDRPVSELSQGQKHLVCLMSVLAMLPSVIILDEPFAGLDIPTTRQLRRILDGLDQTVVEISHDPASLRGYDRVIWLEDGMVRDCDVPAKTLPIYERAMEDAYHAGADIIS